MDEAKLMTSSKPRVLVTGAGSFIGSHLVARLITSEREVVALHRSPPPPWLGRAAEAGAVRLVRADLTEGVPSAVPACDVVIHVAAISKPPERTIDEYVRNNFDASRNIAAWAKAGGAPKAVYLSSMKIYGQVDVPVVGPDTLFRQPDAYGLTKYLGELAFRELAAELPTVALRIPGIVGSGAHRNWLALTMETVRAGRPLTVFNPDAPFNNVVHVEDLAVFLDHLVDRSWVGFDAMPIGAADAMTIAEVARFLIEATGSGSSLNLKPGLSPSFIIDNQRAIDGYGYQPAPLATILRRYSAAA